MSKIGFIVKVKSKGKEYYYLRKSERVKGVFNNSSAKNIYKKADKNIYSFGSKEKSLNSLSEWEKNIERLPDQLKEMGYRREDVLKWIEKIKND